MLLNCYSFLWFSFAWNIFFHPLTSRVYVSLYLKWVSCRQHIYGSCFCVHSDSPCPLVAAFNPFTFKVIIEESWEKTLENPLDCKEIQPVLPKGNQSWIFTGRTDAEAETPILWPPDAKNWLIGKDPDDGKDWRWEEKRMTEDEMVGWHHWLNGHEFE